MACGIRRANLSMLPREDEGRVKTCYELMKSFIAHGGKIIHHGPMAWNLKLAKSILSVLLRQNKKPGTNAANGTVHMMPGGIQIKQNIPVVIVDKYTAISGRCTASGKDKIRQFKRVVYMGWLTATECKTLAQGLGIVTDRKFDQLEYAEDERKYYD